MNRANFAPLKWSNIALSLCLAVFGGLANAQTESDPTSRPPKEFSFSDLVVSPVPRRIKIGQTVHFTVKNVGKFPQTVCFFLGVQPRGYNPQTSSQSVWPMFTDDLWDVTSDHHKKIMEVKPGRTLHLSWTPNTKLFSELYLRNQMLKIEVEDVHSGAWAGPTYYSTPFQVVR